MVEFQPSKLAVWVRFPSPALWCSKDGLIPAIAAVAQLVEYVLGKDGVMGSSPISSFSGSGQLASGAVDGEFPAVGD